MASVPIDQERLRQAPTGELVRSLLADLGLMVQRDAELAKLEIKDKASRLGIVGGLMAGALVVALLALGTLIAASVLALAVVLPAWASALIVGTVLVMVAAVLFLLGRARRRSLGPLAPTETIETVREDLTWMRRETERLRTSE